MKKQFFIFFVLLTSIQLFSQERRSNKVNKPLTIRAHVGIPRSITSEAFYVSFNGVYELNTTVNYMVVDNFYAGIGYQNSLFVNSNKFRDQIGNDLNTRLETHTPMARFGYDYFIRTNAYLSFALNTGYSYHKFTGRQCKGYDSLSTSSKFSSMFVQPEFSANFIVDKFLAFNFMISYNNQLAKYDQSQSCLKYYYDYQKYGDKYIMSWITFGFGVNVLIGSSSRYK
ncbi:MAG: hypothetical protein AB7O73_11785 [Bacteroidia bacterium]